MRSGRLVLPGFAALMLGLGAGCHRPAGPSASAAAGATERGTSTGEKSYPLHGTVVSTNAARGEVTVAHRAIAGWMPAMTMPYRLAQPGILGELHPGDQIMAKVEVGEGPDGQKRVSLDEVDVVGQADPNRLPAVAYHVPTRGETVPDYTLLDQSGKHIDLEQFRGKVLLVTFIYTRCPLPDFCVRMSNNFDQIDRMLAQDQALYRQTHLLSVSFDPDYDTPAVLRSYGGAHTGRYTREDFAHWTFAAPSQAELPRMEQYFDVGVNGSQPATLTHSLSTVLIGKDGKVMDWYPSNEWSPAAVAKQMKQAAGA